MPNWPFFILMRYRLYRWFNLLLERVRYALVKPTTGRHFWVITCSWNSGSTVLKCIESVYVQNYDRAFLKHVFIDDNSSDGSSELIIQWMEDNPDHNLVYIRNDVQVGGTQNTLEGFRMVPEGAIVIELNGDDWLPDAEVIPLLNKVYADDDVWMTYNSYRYANLEQNRKAPVMLRPVPLHIVENNGIRDYLWMTKHLHTFRSELFGFLDDQVFIDPLTGDFWESSDDQAIYLSMFELAGVHARHIFRDMYVYNHRSLSDDVVDLAGSRQRKERIRAMKKYLPLDRLR